MNQVNTPSEPIFAALWDQIQTAASEATPFVTMSRRWQQWSDMSDADMPALFQLQHNQPAQQHRPGLTKWVFKASIWVYVNFDPSDKTTPISPMLNAYRDAIVSAMLPAPGDPRNLQTLGNLVERAFIDGEITFDEGLAAPPSVMVFPITIISGV